MDSEFNYQKVRKNIARYDNVTLKLLENKCNGKEREAINRILLRLIDEKRIKVNKEGCVPLLYNNFPYYVYPDSAPTTFLAEDAPSAVAHYVNCKLVKVYLGVKQAHTGTRTSLSYPHFADKLRHPIKRRPNYDFCIYVMDHPIREYLSSPHALIEGETPSEKIHNIPPSVLARAKSNKFRSL